jgi:hypothetical protein
MSTHLDKEVVAKALQSNKNKISETDFVNVWLPAFVEGDKGVGVAWVKKVSGGVSCPVLVVDKSDTVIFEVPALMPTLKNEEIDGVNTAFRRHSELAEQGYAGADEFLIKTIGSVHKSLSNDHVDVWNSIFGRYGYLDKVVKEETGSKGQKYVEEDLF